MFSAIIFFVTLVLTLTSVKEVPLILEEDERPLTCKLNNQLFEKF